MKKSIISIISIVSILISSFSVSAAEVPRESVPCNASNEAMVLVESFIGDILAEVKNGLGYADARAKSNRIFFNAWLNGQTNGYSYGELVDIANAAIWQYRDMYLRPDFYANNLEKVRVIIAPVIEANKSVFDFPNIIKSLFNSIVLHECDILVIAVEFEINP